MNIKVNLDKVLLIEVSKKVFYQQMRINNFTNSDRIEHRKFKYFFIKYGEEVVGYVVLVEVCEKNKNRIYWILANIEVYEKYRNGNIGKLILSKIHDVLISKLSLSSYIITLSSYIMYKMIKREFQNGVIDFYCLINQKYSVMEMKEEEKTLETFFRDNPNGHADMIISFDEEESERVKLLYFKK